jgi:hypothetical protein
MQTCKWWLIKQNGYQVALLLVNDDKEEIHCGTLKMKTF